MDDKEIEKILWDLVDGYSTKDIFALYAENSVQRNKLLEKFELEKK